MTFSSFHVLLPQTLFRLFGLQKELLKNKPLLQYPFIDRFGFSAHQARSLYTFAGLISEFLQMNYNAIAKTHRNLADSDMLVDCQLVNLRKYYETFQSTNSREIKILDYSSLGHRSLVLTDLKSGVDFLRAAKRNSLFSREISPSLIVHWDDYAKIRQQTLLKQSWKHMFLETHLIVENSRLFVNKISVSMDEFDFLNEIQDLAVILCPHVTQDWHEIKPRLPDLISSIEKQIGDTVKTILVKPHRASSFIFPSKDTVRGTKIFSMNDVFLRNIPIELIALGRSLPIVSYPSSSVFSNNYGKKFILLAGKGEDLREYGLMLSRSRLRHKVTKLGEFLEDTPCHHNN
jgi:hypothetical protein